MDFKIKNHEQPSTDIQYVRSYDISSDDYKSNRCFQFIFQYKKSFILAIFSTALVVCLSIMMIYFIAQSEFTQSCSESLIIKKEPSISSQISLSLDSKTKNAVFKISTKKKLIWPTLLTLQKNFDMNRIKRQIRQNVPNCISRYNECKIILDNVKDINKSMHEKLDRLYNILANKGVLKNSDPKETKFCKIMECLQCRNLINHNDNEYSDSETFYHDIIRNINNHGYENEETNKDRENCNETIEKISTTPRTFQETSRSNFVSYNESQVSHNVNVTPIILSTAETTQTSQQNQFIPQNSWSYIPLCFYGPSSSTKTYQFKHNSKPLFFTAYTTSHGINFGRLNQPIKLVFPNGQVQTFTNLNILFQQFQPKLFPDLQLSQLSANSQFSHSFPPSPFSQRSQPSHFSQVSEINLNQDEFFRQQNLPYYCTYILIPTNYQQQISSTKNLNSSKFHKEFGIASKEFTDNIKQSNPSQDKSNNENNYHNQQQSWSRIPSEFQYQFSKDKNNVTAKAQNIRQRNKTSETTNKYENSEQFLTLSGQCSGFICNPPYKKCLKLHQRCDGQVDCMSAEDEIGCPSSGYYTRFQNFQPELSTMITDSQAMSTISTFEEGRKQTTMSTFEDERKQSTLSGFREEQSRNSSNMLSSDMIQKNNETSNITTIDNEWIKTKFSKGRNERTTTYIDQTTMISTNLVTERTLETESSTFAMIIPDIPHQFICKKIMQTISLEKRCNNVFDCEDTSDEKDCKCKDYLRLSHPSAICDGHVDCPDESDEVECDLCNKNEYHCYKSGGCIPKLKKCDQSMDCKLNEDELDCFALTDGHQINLDLNKQSYLNLEGILSRYDNGVWRPFCFKSEFPNKTKQIGAGQKICEYLGYRNVESTNEILIKSSKLIEVLPSKNLLINKENSLNFTQSKRQINNTCHGLQIHCKPILNRKLNVHLKINPKSKERSYIWPWEASIFVDGNYYCSAILLKNNLLLTSSKCSKNIDLRKNYTAALLGVTSNKFPYKCAYEQSSPIINITYLYHSNASLFKLNNDIHMTRYVQPLHLTNGILPASKDDICIAIGVNSRYQRQVKFLQPVLSACPKCHRCYIEKIDKSTCSIKNISTSIWSGYVVCLSSNGWYPAGIFQDKDENCGFTTKQIFNNIDYVDSYHPQNTDEISEPFVEPYCDGVRCTLGQCISWNNVCNGIRDCRDGVDENEEQCKKIRERCENDISECKCNKAELSCGNGNCIPKESFCDGKVDCLNGADEPATCNCGEYLKLTELKRFCDGRRHCLDKSDENYKQCMCKDSSFKCQKSIYNDTIPCIPQDFVCDGEFDCPNKEDESEEICWTLKSNRTDPKGKGEVMQRSFGVWRSECFPQPVESQKEVTSICRKLGYKSGILVDASKLTESQFVPRNDFYMFQLNDNTWITLRNDVSFGIWKKPESSCYRLFVQCF